MSKKIIILYIVLFLGVSSYFGFIMYKRNQNSIKQNKDVKVIENTFVDLNNENVDMSDNIEDFNSSHKPPLYEITREDCDDECENIENVQKKKYCMEICGLVKSSFENDCLELRDIEKDYCLRDKAVKERDIKICDKIVDGGVARQCRNRISEDIIDDIM